jgi:hypothetical protein
MVPLVDEATAPTDESMNPLCVQGLRLVVEAAPQTPLADFVQDVDAAVENSLDAGLSQTAAQHVVPRLSLARGLSGLGGKELGGRELRRSAVRATDGEHGGLARDLGVGTLAGLGENLQEMGRPLRV